MNGAHDLGGMHGFGPVIAEQDEPVFHADWERRVFALNLSLGWWRRWNGDMSRHARELMPPADYLASTYYEHWLFGLLVLLQKSDLLQPDDVRRVRETPESIPAPTQPTHVQDGALRRDDVERLVRAPRGTRLDDPVAPRFQAGDRVLGRNIHPVGHTRLPRYVRGRQGVVDRDYGVFIFPDSHAAGLGPKPQHVYSVRFEARELWGPDASPIDTVYVDLWDDYLEAAPRNA